MSVLLLTAVLSQTAYEVELTLEVNIYRASEGLPLLQHDQRLSDACYHWCRERAVKRDLKHCYFPELLRYPWLRVDNFGAVCAQDKAFTFGWPAHDLVTENGLRFRVRSTTAQRAVRAWRSSPAHDAALLWPEATHCGGSKSGKVSFLLIGRQP